MAEDFIVTITDPTRKAEIEAILGTATVQVTSPFPERADLPGKPNALISYLDLKAITDEQRDKFIRHIAQKFDLTEQFVRDNLDRHGILILDEHCVVTIRNPQRWF
jgi:hypothetical protein